MTTFPTTPTLNGTTVNTEWMMNHPVYIYRALRTLVQQRMVGGLILSGRVDLTGSGMTVFGVAEGIFASRGAQRIAPGGEYPLATTGDGTPATAIIDKTGLSEEFPQELVARRRDDVAAKKLLKLANSIAFGFDQVVLSAVASAVTQTQAAAAAWNTNGADPFLDTLLSGAKVDELNQGYDVNVILARPVQWARLVRALVNLGALPRESAENVILTGRFVQIAGLTIVKTTNMPPGVEVMVLDSLQLGSIAYERLGGPGWTGDPLDVESKVEPTPGVDGWRVYVRKLAVPMVQEPGAAVKVTGVV